MGIAETQASQTPQLWVVTDVTSRLDIFLCPWMKAMRVWENIDNSYFPS